MPNGRIEGGRKPLEGQRTERPLAESKKAYQIPSGGGELTKWDRFIDGLIYYLGFGWAWGFEPRSVKEDLIASLHAPSQFIPILRTLDSDTIENCKELVKFPHIKNLPELFADPITGRTALECIEEAERLLGKFDDPKAKSLARALFKEPEIDRIYSFLTDEEAPFPDVKNEEVKEMLNQVQKRIS